MNKYTDTGYLTMLQINNESYRKEPTKFCTVFLPQKINSFMLSLYLVKRLIPHIEIALTKYGKGIIGSRNSHKGSHELLDEVRYTIIPQQHS